ncbi:MULTISPECIES: TraB/GumN family protein [Sphingomonas]|uniref:TraB/GumN family protein n=1 Tax=Sphingomonas TaxID=13687 RepID=UPI000832AB3E|nr:TraB/GumN family protein [Sphingomonas sp. CCH10-B3]
MAGGRWVLIGLAALLPGCDRPRPIEARPALYLVQDADTRIWLLGTVHALPDRVQWETPAIVAAERAADTLVTELPALAPAVASETFARIGKGEGLPPIVDRVPPALRSKLEATAARARLSLADLNGMKSWAAALTLGAALAGIDHGARPAAGVEAVIGERLAGKPRIGLETLAGQLGFFDALTEDDQRRLLAASISDVDGYRATLDAWAKGDEARIAALVARPLAGSPTIEAVLLTRRNARWAAWIGGRMAQPGRLLVAVGAGHLAGPKSVVARLRAAGWRVTRVQ